MPHWKPVARYAAMGALVAAVTAGGAAIGAVVVAPALDGAPLVTWAEVQALGGEALGRAADAARALREPVGASLRAAARHPAMPAAVAATFAAALLLAVAAGRRRVRHARTPSPARGAAVVRRRPDDRTPKAVQALAASGAAPADIALRTGLSLDAVSLLLALAPRQLQPPAA
jgi:hypothetical protein